MDKLPYDYCNYFRKDIAIILEPYKLEDLLEEALKLNVKAQKAILQKFQIGCNEAQDWTIIQRIDKILWLWDQIKDINKTSNAFGLIWGGHIVSGIKEVLFSDCFYNSNGKPPEQEIISYAIDQMEKHGLGEQFTNKIVECYERYKPKPPKEKKKIDPCESTFVAENRWRTELEAKLEPEFWGPGAWKQIDQNIATSYRSWQLHNEVNKRLNKDGDST